MDAEGPEALRLGEADARATSRSGRMEGGWKGQPMLLGVAGDEGSGQSSRADVNTAAARSSGASNVQAKDVSQQHGRDLQAGRLPINGDPRVAYDGEGKSDVFQAVGCMGARIGGCSW